MENESRTYHKTIGVKPSTKEELDSVKLVPQESYDNVITRLVTEHKKEKSNIEFK